jgi:rfaE bifunctional protein kinase chain/domain
MGQIDTKSFFESINHMKVLIIGDVMVDSYLWGRVDRISPEAPVPVVEVKKRTNSLGGAANVALNVNALGARPILCSVVGDDPKGNDFIGLMKEQKLSIEGIIRSNKRITTTKFRVFGNSQQMLRVDEETKTYLEPDDEAELRDTIFSILDNQKIDVIIFQDYDKGVNTRHLIRSVIEKANNLEIPVTVDPKKNNFTEYKEVALFKPNLKEIREGLQMEVNLEHPWELENAANIIHREQKVQMVLTTLSEHGVFISSLNSENKLENLQIPAHRRNIADVSGAGDTVISVAALCLAAGMTPAEIAGVSNLAGGLVCEEVGVVPLEAVKFRNEMLGI